MNDTRFIAKPHFGNLAEKGLDIKDILTYTTIRSFYNSQDRFAYPTYETIRKRSGLSKKFISDSIKRLESTSLLQVFKIVKVKVMHSYLFPELEQFDKVSFDVFDLDLSAMEKSILLLLREYCDRHASSTVSLNEIAELSSISLVTLRKHFKALIEKEFIDEFFVPDIERSVLEPRFKLSSKLQWTFQSAPLKGQPAETTWGEDMMRMYINMIKKMRSAKPKETA